MIAMIISMYCVINIFILLTLSFQVHGAIPDRTRHLPPTTQEIPTIRKGYPENEEEGQV